MHPNGWRLPALRRPLMKAIRPATVMSSLAIALIAHAGGPSTSRADGVDLQQVRKALRATWDAVKGIEIHGDEFLCDAEGRQDTRPGLSTQKFFVAIGPEGRRAHKEVTITAKGVKTVLTHFRQDGKKHWDIRYFDDSSESIKLVTITNQN